MSVLHVKDVLARAKDFEARLECYYADIRDRSTNDGVRLLTQYLVRHCRRLPKALLSYSESDLKHIQDVLLKYDLTQFDPNIIFVGKELPADASAEQLIGKSLEFLKCIDQFYTVVADLHLGNEASGLFLCLHQLAERDAIELNKIKATHYF